MYNLFFILFVVLGVQLAADTGDEAKRIFRRLTGLNLQPTDPLYAQMVEALEQGNAHEAARIVTADMHFYATAVRNWSSPWSSALDLTYQPFDDLQATVAGIVRDRIDFRLFLTGDFYYHADPKYPIQRVSDFSNLHYEALDSAALNLAEVLVKSKRANGRAIGVFGSRAFASAYYSSGTNRRAVKFSLEHFLCAKQSRWREASLPDDFVRRDVNRIPTGSVREYQTECRGCHAPMDSLSGAFSFVDFQLERIVFGQNVFPKMNSNASVFPDGHIVNNGNWRNYLALTQQDEFGWRGPVEGDTLEEFASMLSQSRAFSRCMVQTAVKQVCPNYSSRGSKAFVERLTNHFEADDYDMREVFELAVIDPEC
jgi:hypothetical protein